MHFADLIFLFDEIISFLDNAIISLSQEGLVQGCYFSINSLVARGIEYDNCKIKDKFS